MRIWRRLGTRYKINRIFTNPERLDIYSFSGLFRLKIWSPTARIFFDIILLKKNYERRRFMANKDVYKGGGFGLTKAPAPPKDQPKSTVVRGNDLRTGGGNGGKKKGK